MTDALSHPDFTPRRAQIDAKRVRQLAAQGLVAREIAAEIGCLPSSINRLCQQLRIRLVRDKCGPKDPTWTPTALETRRAHRRDRHYRPAVDWDAVPVSTSRAA